MKEGRKRLTNKPKPDQLKKLPGGALIQHGPHNDRIYLMKMGRGGAGALPADLIAMAKQHDYSKVFVKAPAEHLAQFLQAGYVEEATIPRLFNGAETGIFLGYYLNELRATEPEAARLDRILHLALDKSGSAITSLDRDLFARQQCEEGDVEEMAAIYQTVFQTYPFPIHDPAYLLDNMQNQVDYFAVESAGDLVALSSAEIDASAQNVEMTDFATLPEWRGNSLGLHLLRRMEKEMQQKGIKMAYTIARAVSIGMNIVFAKLGYTYGGRLKNNTNISGEVESMNIWYKAIS
jgi:putative beta-lysine N-acetyltransferase